MLPLWLDSLSKLFESVVAVYCYAAHLMHDPSFLLVLNSLFSQLPTPQTGIV